MEVVNATYQSLHTLITNKLQAVRTKKLAHNKITLSKNRKKKSQKEQIYCFWDPVLYWNCSYDLFFELHFCIL
jgi:hypothetical protein